MPSPEQWTGGGMDQIYKTDNQKCTGTKYNTHIALLQIRSTLLGQQLPSPASLLFSHPKGGIMQILSTLVIGPNNDDECYEAVVTRWTKKDKNYDTPRNSNFIYIGSTGVIKQEDGGPWIHGTVVGKGRPKPQQQIIHNTCNKHMTTDHQEDQACKDNTDHSWAIPLGSVRHTEWQIL